MRSHDYNWYRQCIFDCVYSDDVYDYLDEAAENTMVDIEDFAVLTKLVQDLIDEGKLV